MQRKEVHESCRRRGGGGIINGGRWGGEDSHDVKGCGEDKRGDFMNVRQRQGITSKLRDEEREVQQGGYQMETAGCEKSRRTVLITRYGECEMRVGGASAVVFNG